MWFGVRDFCSKDNVSKKVPMGAGAACERCQTIWGRDLFPNLEKYGETEALGTGGVPVSGMYAPERWMHSKQWIEAAGRRRRRWPDGLEGGSVGEEVVVRFVSLEERERGLHQAQGLEQRRRMGARPKIPASLQQQGRHEIVVGRGADECAEDNADEKKAIDCLRAASRPSWCFGAGRRSYEPTIPNGGGSVTCSS